MGGVMPARKTANKPDLVPALRVRMIASSVAGSIVKEHHGRDGTRVVVTHNREVILALCDDGSIWRSERTESGLQTEWERLPELLDTLSMNDQGGNT